MNNKWIRLIAAALLATGPVLAGAATVALAPSATTVGLNDTFTVDLTADFSDTPGAHPGNYTGQVVIDFDPALIEFQSFGSSFLAKGPTAGSSGGNTTITLTFDNFNMDSGPIGTYNFKAVGLGTADIGAKDVLSGLGGSFANHSPTEQPFEPVVTGTSITISEAVVPLPGAAWLMLSGLGMLAMLRGRAAR